MLEGLINKNEISNNKISLRTSEFDYLTISNGQLEFYKNEGWVIDKKNSKSYRIKKIKKHDIAFEDRVWSILAKMGFKFINSNRNFKINYAKDENIPGKQIDVFVCDEETAIIIECKSSIERRPVSFQKDIAEIDSIRDGIIKTVKKEINPNLKVAWIFATNNCIVSENDKARLKENNIIYFNQDDISYYENLVAHLGKVAKYQLLGLLFKGLVIPELKNKIPAIRGKMGGYTYYSFSIEPETLLKLSFVLHRTDTSKEAFDSYQRMVKKTRIKSISNFINNSGYFANNLILNINSKNNLQFDLATSSEHHSISEIGILHLPKKYHSVFIIDGQHRLYGYGDTEWKSKNTIPVVAFENLPAEEQTKIFVNINHEQKSVAKSLLKTLMSEFNWNSDQPDAALDALKTRLIHRLNSDDNSPLYKRIITSEEKKSLIRCLNLEYISSYGLNKTKMFGIIQKGQLVKTGYFWAGDYLKTLEKSYEILSKSLEYVANGLPNQWNAGSGEGGFIAMNIGIATLIRIIDDIIEFLVKNEDFEPETKSANEVFINISRYLNPIISFLNNKTSEELKKLRGQLGGGGVDKIIKEFQFSIHESYSEFNPQGLDKWIKDNSGIYNTPSKILGDEIQLTIRNFIFKKLKEQYGEINWWKQGVDREIQKYCSNVAIDDGHLEPEDHYLLTIHYQKIVKDNKEFLLEFFTHPDLKSAALDKRISWFVKLNSIRKKFSHPERDKVTEDEFLFLNELKDWLFKKIGGA